VSIVVLLLLFRGLYEYWERK